MRLLCCIHHHAAQLVPQFRHADATGPIRRTHSSRPRLRRLRRSGRFLFLSLYFLHDKIQRRTGLKDGSQCSNGKRRIICHRHCVSEADNTTASPQQFPEVSLEKPPRRIRKQKDSFNDMQSPRLPFNGSDGTTSSENVS